MIREILPGIFHWKAFHEGIQEEVDSYFLEGTSPPVLIDPLLPREGLEGFRSRKAPIHIYLTNRLHYRDSDRFQEAFGCRVWCHHAGLHEFHGGPEVAGFEHGELLPGDIRALKVGSLCPEETALLIPLGEGALAIGDALVGTEDSLAFMPDELIGEGAEAVKRGIRQAFREHLEQPFDHLLFAHSSPWVGAAKRRLGRFIAA